MTNKLRKRVADILHSEHRVSQTKLRGLSVKDTTELHAIASGTRVPEFRIKALTVLAATRDQTAGEIFHKALRDSAAGVEVRAAGATWLSRLGGMAVEGALMESLAVETLPIVQHKIVAGLARVGSVAALRRLADGVQAMDPAVREHAQFAQSVIAFRAGMTGFELPVLDATRRLPAPTVANAAVHMTDARPEDALRVIEQTAPDSYGVVGDTEGVAMIQCGRRNLAVAIDAPLRATPVKRLAGPTIAGLVAVQAEADGSFATSLLILTWPNSEGGVHVSVNRPSGRVMYFGEGKIDGDTVRFQLDAVSGPGATETTVTGTLAGGRIVDLQVASGKTMERMRPVPMEVP